MKVGLIGLGYFSQFHIQAWQNIPQVTLLGGADLDSVQRGWAASNYQIPVFDDAGSILAQNPDVVDIIAPSAAHLTLIKAVVAKGRVLICQKPFCQNQEEAERAIEIAQSAGACLVIHENFRFQPWHRTIKSFLDSGHMGQIYNCQFNLRPGDGRGADAYLARQPAFRTMPRLLIHETGVHFVDLFRWFFGEITDVYADVTRLNPAISAEDSGILVMNHETGVRSVFDGNRLADHETDNPRRTMGEMWIEGEGGVLQLDGCGTVRFRPFGQKDWQIIPLVSQPDDTVFGGGCVAALIEHVVAGRESGIFENEAVEYLRVVKAVEAAYQSAETGQRIQIS